MELVSDEQWQSTSIEVLQTTIIINMMIETINVFKCSSISFFLGFIYLFISCCVCLSVVALVPLLRSIWYLGGKLDT